MAQRRDGGKRGRPHKVRPQGKPQGKGKGRPKGSPRGNPRGRPQGRSQGGPHGGPPRPEGRPRRHAHKRPDGPPPLREMIAKGKATDLGLDGKLRVELEPVEVEVAARLGRGRGALVFTPRGDRLGQVDAVIGTTDAPIAVVRIFPEMRKEASEVQGRELFLG